VGFGSLQSHFAARGPYRKTKSRKRCQDCYIQHPSDPRDQPRYACKDVLARRSSTVTSALKALALQKFRPSAEHCWDSGEFAQAVHTVYTTTPGSDVGLRDIVVATILEHMSLLTKPEIEATMKEDQRTGVRRAEAQGFAAWQ